MGREKLEADLYPMHEVEYMRSPGVNAVRWRISGQGFLWAEGRLAIETPVGWLPLTSIASPESAIAFTLGWDARHEIHKAQNKGK